MTVGGDLTVQTLPIDPSGRQTGLDLLLSVLNDGSPWTESRLRGMGKGDGRMSRLIIVRRRIGIEPSENAWSGSRGMLKMSKLRLLIASVLASATTLTIPATGKETARDDDPIIDMHMHADTVEKGADGNPLSRPCNPTPCQGAPGQAKTAEDVLRLTLEAMDRNNIVLGFLSQYPLDNVYHWVETAPGRFIASPLVMDPALIDLDGLRKDYEAGRLGGMGELASQYAGVAVDDPKLQPFFALAEEFDVPVLIHHHGTAGPSDLFRISIGHPEQLEEVLIRRPKLRLFMENSGFPFLDETIALMYRYPQAYGDVSTGTWIYPRQVFHSYLRGLMDAGLGKRIMFGSDQMQWPEAIDDAINAIESARFLSEEQKRDIFYNNAARFLRLSEEEIDRHHGR